MFDKCNNLTVVINKDSAKGIINAEIQAIFKESGDQDEKNK